ncbi:SubName: Full=Related to small GTP-binding protein-Korarchaeum cryptofilum {ECO:0000313/EMBL:CCA67315.1} [Serendipita indica DSM 11827]|uniref:Related to small GTP-binding protein-Korarchaeum cryptofilum n=1 Tax=Serendipita indica (strain DSM 11827) TaxID=1109443 RepID=G4T7L4_SERID|nr:SubName: Full=Related to small GTP-binding protein-Korarchaeum cryptofilum {ECO:0000313/EMBL:CCA67315.1} [Serendipita indica DSM 11827]CCA67315.1 related to small GTP-binding protein-Korarchaeum cryptofilum [Serendipita indica DSM 11827]
MNPEPGNLPPTTPTVGFNLETIHFTRGSLVIRDFGGSDTSRALWTSYYNASAYIFVVSAKDKERFPLAKQELAWAASHHNLNDYPLLILVNRLGEEGAATLDEVKGALEVTKLDGMRWDIKPVSAETGHGLKAAFSWLLEQL